MPHQFEVLTVPRYCVVPITFPHTVKLDRYAISRFFQNVTATQPLRLGFLADPLQGVSNRDSSIGVSSRASARGF